MTSNSTIFMLEENKQCKWRKICWAIDKSVIFMVSTLTYDKPRQPLLRRTFFIFLGVDEKIYSRLYSDIKVHFGPLYVDTWLIT